MVWRRDEGKCVQCDSSERIEYDHIIPVSKGGSNTVRNIQLLCELIYIDDPKIHLEESALPEKYWAMTQRR